MRYLLLFQFAIQFFNTQAQQSINWTKQTEFCISKKAGMEYVWGEPAKLSGVYFDEQLPAFFHRKLSFKEINTANAKLKWILTGLQGSVTITLSNDSLELVQQYYNSFGFNKWQNGKLEAKRFPSADFTASKASIQGESIHSLAVEVNSTLDFNVFVNDKRQLTQQCQIDLSKHQLKAEGNELVSCGILLEPAVESVHVQFNNKKSYQVIRGFGGTTSPIAYHLLSEGGKTNWWQLLKEYNLLIQREYPMAKRLNSRTSNWDEFSQATPHYYGDNFPNGEVSDFSYNKKILQNGGEIIFEFWNLPDWMIDTTVKKNGKPAGVPIVEKYTAAIIAYCKKAKQTTGQAPNIVGVQNEVTQPGDVWRNMAISLRKALDANGFSNVKIHMHNAVNLEAGIKAVKEFSVTPESWSSIDFTSTNFYDYQNYFTNVDAYDTLINKWNNAQAGKSPKPFLSIEMCVNDNRYQSGSYKIAFQMAQLYHKNLVQMNATTLFYCWLLLNTVQPSFAASRSLFTIDESNNNVPVASSFQLRVFGSFSRHILKGFHRVTITSSNSDILASAYANGNKQVVILLNKGNAPIAINVNDLKGGFTKMEIVSQYKVNEQKIIPANKEIIIEPGNIITLFN